MNNPGYSLEVDDVFQEAKAGSKKVFTPIQGYKPSKIKIYGMSRLAVYRRPLSLGRFGILAEERIIANLLLKYCHLGEVTIIGPDPLDEFELLVDIPLITQKEQTNSPRRIIAQVSGTLAIRNTTPHNPTLAFYLI